jgi:hypothetical protein
MNYSKGRTYRLQANRAQRFAKRFEARGGLLSGRLATVLNERYERLLSQAYRARR